MQHCMPDPKSNLQDYWEVFGQHITWFQFDSCNSEIIYRLEPKVFEAKFEQQRFINFSGRGIITRTTNAIAYDSKYPIL